MEKFLPVQEASAAVARDVDTAYSLQLVMDHAKRGLQADRRILFLIDDERQEFWSILAHGLGNKEIRLPIGVGIAGCVAVTGETLNISDAYADHRFNPAVDESTGYRTKTVLCVPVRGALGNTIGVIQVINKLCGNFTRQDEDELRSLCTQAALLLGAQLPSRRAPRPHVASQASVRTQER